MSRTRMLSRLRRLARPTDGPSPSLPDFPEYADPVQHFQQEFEAAGGIFLDAREQGIEACLRAILRRTEATEIFWEQESLFQRHSIPIRLRDPLAYQSGRLVCSVHPRGQVRLPLLLHSRPWTRANLANVSLSCSDARFGIAETGTLLHELRPGQGRLLSSLPDSQLFLLSEDRLLHNSRQLFERWQPGAGSLATLVSGPSRTADIEKKLVIGVHGPRRCLVILTDAGEGSNP